MDEEGEEDEEVDDKDEVEEEDEELLVGGGAYCMQLEPWGEAASPDAAPCAGDIVVVADDVDGEDDDDDELWWFSVCRRKDRASQYDFPQPSALHSYGFLFRCVSMWPLLEMEIKNNY